MPAAKFDAGDRVKEVAPVLWVPVPLSVPVSVIYARVNTPLAFAATVKVLPSVAVTSAGAESRSA
jgi:hypothetical protein